jgi:hypothetical protein
MFLSASPTDDFRAAEITTENTDAAAQGSQSSFRATEIVAQNAAASAATNVPRLLMAGGGLALIYLFLKGRK